MNKKTVLSRAIHGLRDGTLGGIACGVLFGVGRRFEGDFSWSWHLDFFCGMVGFVLGTALVCAIGRAIADSVSGAMYGGIGGLVLSIIASAWTTDWARGFLGDQSQAVVAVVGATLAVFPCVLGGAAIVALIQKWMQTL